ncbi:hypothetical protein BD779DRAFT_1558532 [Infundibulicybe gibba]|nr:hypothetical protein BD779DRAFT_1558532 [Infundibulicybe gibba]
MAASFAAISARFWAMTSAGESCRLTDLFNFLLLIGSPFSSKALFLSLIAALAEVVCVGGCGGGGQAPESDGNAAGLHNQ